MTKGAISPKPTRRHARNAEEFENQMMALAMQRSRERLEDGTASSAEIVWWLNQASPKARLERKNLELQGELLRAKVAEINESRQGNKDYAAAMEAFAGYLPAKGEDIVDGEFREI